MDNITTTTITEAAGHLYGFLFVVLVLSLLWLIVEGIGTWFRHQEKKALATVPAAPEQHPSAIGKTDLFEQEELVVVAAAAALVLGGQSRIVSVQHTVSNWGREGRRQQVQSHFIAHKAAVGS